MNSSRRRIENLFDWNDYGLKVLDGTIPVCRWTRLAVERHYRDMKDGASRGLFFSEERAQYALQSFLFLKHSKGEFAGRMFVPSPWQQFWIALAFGWTRADGTRRFREVNQVVARKNGKTTMLAGVGLYMFFWDNEPGAEVYAAATKRDQARILHNEAVQMVRTSPNLRRYIVEKKDGLFLPDKMDRFVPLSRDSKSFDGMNPHCSILDEIHAHPTSDIYDVLKSGVGARRQPLTWMITTAGFDLTSLGYEKYLYSLKVLDGSIQDDEHLAVIYTVDDREQWDNPVEWLKANPNLGVSVYQENMRMDCELSIRQPSYRPNFLTKNLNIWLSSGTTWIPMEQWRACADPLLTMDEFRGCDCWIGMDLAEKSDIAALSIVFQDGGRFYCFFRLYLNAYEVDKQENDHLRRFRDRNELIVCDGNITDFNRIRDDIKDICETYNVQEVAYDPYFSQYFGASLADDGLPMVEFAQSAKNMGPAILELENLILEGRIRHTGSSIMEWMMSNVVIRESKFTGIKHATKEARENKIDGPVAMMMALSRAMASEPMDIDGALSRMIIV